MSKNKFCSSNLDKLIAAALARIVEKHTGGPFVEDPSVRCRFSSSFEIKMRNLFAAIREQENMADPS